MFLSNLFALTSTSTTTETASLSPVEIIIGIVLMVLTLLIVVAVLLQSSKDQQGLSGSISGSSDTFFSKSKAGTRDKILSKVTLGLSIVFAIVCVIMYLIVSH